MFEHNHDTGLSTDRKLKKQRRAGGHGASHSSQNVEQIIDIVNPLDQEDDDGEEIFAKGRPK